MHFKKMESQDLEFLNQVRNLVAKEFLHDSRTFTIEETRRWYQETNPDFYMIWKEETLIGYFRLSNFSRANNNIYIGADIHPAHQGKGHAYQAYTMFIPKLFNMYDLHKISLEVLATNTRAINLYKRLGFVQEGIKREEVLKDGAYVDSIIMSILRNDRK